MLFNKTSLGLGANDLKKAISIQNTSLLFQSMLFYRVSTDEITLLVILRVNAVTELKDKNITKWIETF